MARTIKWLGAMGLALGLLLGNRGAAAQETQAQPAVDPAVWGIYAQLVGSTRQASDGYRLHWRWSQPGKELVEEYIAPFSGKLSFTNTITPGPTPGTLHALGSALGGKKWNGTLQPDGSVVFAGTGMLKFSYKATIGSDGAYEIRGVKLRNGVVVSTKKLANNSRYLPIDDAATRVATAVEAPGAAPVAIAATADTAKAADPAIWGLYARLVGTSWSGEGDKVSWKWGAGNTIVEDRSVVGDTVISPGARPGELVGVYGSGISGATYDGRINPDGSILWLRRGLVKTPQRVAIIDGRYREDLVKVDGANQVIKVKSTGWYSQTDSKPVNAAATAAAAGKAEPAPVPTSAGTAPGLPAKPVEAATASPLAPVADAAAQAVAVAPQEPMPPAAPPIDPEQLRQRNRNLHDYYERLINGPYGTPGVWLELTGSGSGISRYRRTEEGAENTFTFIRENGELVVAQVILHFDNELGRFVRYIDGKPFVAAEVARLPGGAFRVQTLPGSSFSAEEAAGIFQDVAFIEDRMESTTSKGAKRVYRWAPENEAASVQAAIQKRQVWLEAERVAAARKAEEERRRQAAAAAALAEQIRQQEAAEQERLAYEAEADAEFEAERLQRAALFQQSRAASEQGLADSISRLNNTVASVEAQQAQYRAQQEAVRAQQEAASRAVDAQRAREATERQNEIARQYEAQRQAQQQAQAAALVVAAKPAPTPPATAPAAGSGQWFVFCVAIKPGAYMDAPGAMFLSAISAVAKQGYSSQASGESFGSRVSAQYGVSVGGGSCTSFPDRATAQARWQEQHDTFGLKSYKKVVTGMPATP